MVTASDEGWGCKHAVHHYLLILLVFTHEIVLPSVQCGGTISAALNMAYIEFVLVSNSGIRLSPVNLQKYYMYASFIFICLFVMLKSASSCQLWSSVLPGSLCVSLFKLIFCFWHVLCVCSLRLREYIIIFG